MFDPATCCRMRLAAVPTVSCKAWLDLKSLLQGTLLPESDVVLEAEHRCLLLQEVLMRRSLNRQRVAQLKLFHPRHQSPAWQGLPRETRLRTVRLFARLLREHSGKVHASGSRKEAGDE